MKIIVATCQFPTSADIQANLNYVRRLMFDAKSRGGDLAHFPEACLSGYADFDFQSHKGFDWAQLSAAIHDVQSLAAELDLWVVLGSAHRLTGNNKPHNSLYIIDDKGQIRDGYDKRFCAGDVSEQTGDLLHYSPGDHFSVFELNGVRCGALICVDCRYPELYREYKRLGVQLTFHSFHAAHADAERFRAMEGQVGQENHLLNPATTLPGITQPAMMYGAAGSNHMWISCPNSAAYRSCWPSFFVRPDGVVTGRLDDHVAGALLSVVDTDLPAYDSTFAWRDRAMNGILNSGSLVSDPRSLNRTEA